MPPKQDLPIGIVGGPSSTSGDANKTSDLPLAAARGRSDDLDSPISELAGDSRHSTTLCPADLDTIRQAQLGGRKGRLPIGNQRRDLDQRVRDFSSRSLHPHVLRRVPYVPRDNDDGKDDKHEDENQNWHREELELLSEFEKFSTAKSEIHASVHHHFLKKNKWLRFILNVATTIAGTSALAAAISAVISGVDWKSFVTAIITLLIGLISSTGDSFEWHKKAADHWIASDRYMHLAMEIRRLKVGHNLGRDYCTVSLLRVSERYAEIHNSAPWANEPNV